VSIAVSQIGSDFIFADHRSHSGRWRCCTRPLLRRSVQHHGRIHAGRKTARNCRVCRNNQPIRLSGYPNKPGGADTTFGKIIEAVERAEKTRAPIQGIADRLAGYLVYFALGSAAVTYLITGDLRSTISVIIVAGACGIAAGTPLSIFGAIGQAARKGSIIKGGLYLEALAAVDTVLLDKTGTLTFGNPEVLSVRPVGDIDPKDLLQAAATAESASEHPLGRAILQHAAKESVSPAETDRFESIAGKGLVCESNGETIIVGSRAFLSGLFSDVAKFPDYAVIGTEVLVARDRTVLGSIVIADVIRPQAIQAIRNLRQMGLRTELVTGDSRKIAASVGERLGVHAVRAGCLPEDKVDRVQALVAEGKKCRWSVMV